jgi:thiamine pyrophosphate-dependent acetolactate synthase large subunit-like protein
MRGSEMKSDSAVAAVVARDIAGYGARRCFGLLGTANFKISHALFEAGVELISARHEGNAASMADAYAKATGELTLVSVHSGPGLTNAMTGIAEAAKSRTPMLVLAGDVPTGAVKSNFHIDQAELVRSVGAISERIHTPRSAREDTLRAVNRALRDRQTVVLSLPLDVQDAELATNSAPRELPPPAGRLHPDPDAVRRLADAMVRAERPLILGGRGAVVSDAEQALLALAERAGALLATTVCGHGMFAENPWSLGICGGFASPIRTSSASPATSSPGSERALRNGPPSGASSSRPAQLSRRSMSRRRSSATRCRFTRPCMATPGPVRRRSRSNSHGAACRTRDPAGEPMP